MGSRLLSAGNLIRRANLDSTAAGPARLAVALVCALLLSGCSSNQYLVQRPMPLNPLAASLQLARREGPRPTERTRRLVRRYDLPAETPAASLEELGDVIRTAPTPEAVYSYAELSYLAGREAERRQNLGQALEFYGLSVAHAYWYLFAPRLDVARNPYDPQFRGASDLYNAALESVLRIANRQGRLRPGQTVTIQTENHEFEIDIVSRGGWHDDDFQRLEFVSDYDIQGLANRHRSFGLGVPLIAVRRGHGDEDPAEAYYPPGLSFATTAFLRVSCDSLGGVPAGRCRRRCVLELHDPLRVGDLIVEGRRVPLETDLTTPLAYFLDNPDFVEQRDIATVALLAPDRADSLKGLYMLEPYDPYRIPVLMVHGFWSSPTTWMEMFNDLRSNPEIRDRFQFWFYLYPTGQPYWVSATQLRADLEQLRQTLDPARANPMLDQMVLVAHSMGGLVSKLQTISSGDEFWRLLSERPFEELKADPEIRQRVARTVFFEPNPSIRRLVTIATPHRGSELANDYTRWLGRKLIWLPEMMVRATNQLTLQNPGFFRDTELLTVTTSVDALSPDSPVLPALLAAPVAPWVRHHNIVGIDGAAPPSDESSGDGIVRFASAHLTDVASEITVPAEHMAVHTHPRAILEVHRILVEHSRAAAIEAANRQATVR